MASLDFALGWPRHLRDRRRLERRGDGEPRHQLETRWKLLRERVEAMKRIWTHDAAEYHGELVNFDPIWSWPKPVQKPHPPILLGGHTSKTLERVVDYCDGWMPIGGRAGDLIPKIKDLRAWRRRVAVIRAAFRSPSSGRARRRGDGRVQRSRRRRVALACRRRRVIPCCL